MKSRIQWTLLALGAFAVPPMMIYLAAFAGLYTTCTTERMTVVVMSAFLFGLVAILQTGCRQWLLTLTVCAYVVIALTVLPLVALSASCLLGNCCL